MDKRRQSAMKVLKEIKDGSTIMISGFGEAGVPNTLLSQLKGLHPTNLTIVVNSVTRPLSLPHALIEANMVSKVITTSARGRGKGLSKFEEKLRDGEVELECLPQGTFSERIRAGGAGIPAFFTPVGYGTKLGEGKETRNIQGKDCVLEEALTGDFALISANKADRFGNVNFSYTQMNFGPIMATACTTTIVEARLLLEEPLPHNHIQLPSVYVDYLIESEETDHGS